MSGCVCGSRERKAGAWDLRSKVFVAVLGAVWLIIMTLVHLVLRDRISANKAAAAEARAAIVEPADGDADARVPAGGE